MKNMIYLSKYKSVPVFLFALLLSSQMQAQRPWKDYLVIGSAMFVTGMLDGTVESINYHYQSGFKNRFPGADDAFWNPKCSWKNKYKNGDPNQGPAFGGSMDMFICLTDGYHLLHTTSQVIDVATLAYYMNQQTSGKRKPVKSNWKTFAQDFLVLSAIRCIGFHFTYSLVFSQNFNNLNTK